MIEGFGGVLWDSLKGAALGWVTNIRAVCLLIAFVIGLPLLLYFFDIAADCSDSANMLLRDGCIYEAELRAKVIGAINRVLMVIGIVGSFFYSVWDNQGRR